MNGLFEYMRRQLDRTPDAFRRYLYPDIKWDNHMLGLVGPRGVGKTTLFLQHIKACRNLDDTLYLSADHLYFSNHTLYDTACAFSREGGRFLYIDEVHKYPEWSRELKMMYDSLPDMHVYFTGSSILDIEKGEADLSRRAPRYMLQGLSFREYLAIRHGIEAPLLSLDDILANRTDIEGVEHPLPLFREYLKTGYYPFGADLDFATELGQVITRTLEVDIPQYAGMSSATGRKLKKLLVAVSEAAPFKPNMTSLGGKIQISRNNVEEYLAYIEKAGLIAQLRDAGGGFAKLGKTEKVYLDNTNILYALSDGEPDKGTVRETFFFNQMRVNHRPCSSPISDFQIGDVTFEVGGKGKGLDQLKGAERGIVVRDDVEYGRAAVVPLWAFGLNY